MEISFRSSGSAGSESTLRAVEKLARQVVPVLVSDHWPNWEEVTKSKD